jgi:hypothetical protein
MAVQDGMYPYEQVRTLRATWRYKQPKNGTYLYVLPPVIPRSVRTGMYWYVVYTALYLHGTRWYRVVQGGTRWYMTVQQYMVVHGDTWQYKNL